MICECDHPHALLAFHAHDQKKPVDLVADFTCPRRIRPPFDPIFVSLRYTLSSINPIPGYRWMFHRPCRPMSDVELVEVLIELVDILKESLDVPLAANAAPRFDDQKAVPRRDIQSAAVSVTRAILSVTESVADVLAHAIAQAGGDKMPCPSNEDE